MNKKGLVGWIILIVIVLAVIGGFTVSQMVKKGYKEAGDDLKGELASRWLGEESPADFPGSGDYCQHRDIDGDGSFDYTDEGSPVCGGVCDNDSRVAPCLCKVFMGPTAPYCGCGEPTGICCDMDDSDGIEEEEERQFIIDCGGDPDDPEHRRIIEGLGNLCDCDGFRIAIGFD